MVVEQLLLDRKEHAESAIGHTCMYDAQQTSIPCVHDVPKSAIEMGLNALMMNLLAQ